MSAPDERWDVVVVGLHDPRPDKLGKLARHLARVCEMPIDELVEALQDGEVPIYAGIRRHEAERAAHELDGLGAAVDLRVAVATSGAYPILKPDAERRSGTAVGGFIDDSATPPRIADSQVGVLPLEPPAAEDHIGPIAPAPPTVGGARPRAATEPIATRKRTIGESPSSVPPSHPPVGHPLSALSSGLERLSSADAIDGMLGIVGDDHVHPRSATDRATPRDGHAAATTPEADPAPPPPRRGPVGPSLAKPTPPPDRAKPPGSAARGDPFTAPSGSSDLQLDFEAAGLSRPPAPSLSRAPSPGSSGVLPRRTRATDAGGTGAAARGFGVEHENRPLMGPETVSATIFGLAAGLAAGLFVAVLLQKGIEQESIVGYESEMQQALAAPDEVAAGTLRAADAIEADLETAYSDVRRGFLLKWLAIGFPIGIVLGRLKRW